MTTDQHKIEATYAVDVDTDFPALEELPGVETVQRGDDHEIEATYFDTADLALATTVISLRRHTGGAYPGWHLTLPMQKGRFKIHDSLSRATKTVPKSLRTLLVAHSRDAKLQPVAVVRTRRQVRLLLDSHGRTLAEFCDDHVSADTFEGTEPVSWREWKLELIEGDATLLATAAALVNASGGRPSDATKLAKVLGERVPLRFEQASPKPTREVPASQVVQARLLEQVTVSAATTRWCATTPRTPCTRCESPYAAYGTHSRRTAQGSSVSRPSRSATSSSGWRPYWANRATPR